VHLPRFENRDSGCNIYRRGGIHGHYELDPARSSLGTVRNDIRHEDVRTMDIQTDVGIKESRPEGAVGSHDESGAGNGSERENSYVKAPRPLLTSFWRVASVLDP
jgi:hypothetical protein